MPVITPTGGGGGGGSLPWAAFETSLAPTIVDGTQVDMLFTDAFIGHGPLTSVTAGLDTFGDPAVFLPDVGCYLLSLNVSCIDSQFSNLIDPARLEFELQVFNSENDPYMFLDVRRPADPYANGVLTAVVNVLSTDPDRGFAVLVRARNTDYTPQDRWLYLKVVQLATT